MKMKRNTNQSRSSSPALSHAEHGAQPAASIGRGPCDAAAGIRVNIPFIPTCVTLLLCQQECCLNAKRPPTPLRSQGAGFAR